MMLLTSQDVKYCQATANIQGQVKNKPGIIYNNSLFTLVQKYALEELEAAIKEYREDFLDNEEVQSATLMVKEQKAVGIWMHDDRYQQSTKSQEKVEESSVTATSSNTKENKSRHLDLNYIVSKMRGEDGLKIKTRRHKLKLHPHCFLGNEAVDWLVAHFNITRQKAVTIGQNLVTKKIIHHVLDEHFFKDEVLLYRFYQDEDKSMWTSGL
ncbi:Domain found in Dishevelled, Egl-10, and Pleckstrin (DEP) [Xenococcus sp. PCC 7305]|uniref:DEP domain-containing protein n=1 Tax=Xenococcus sp. PCC 7305 TaxID=102125 RepID=UPI0002AC98E1|nr:DEP domain-containing protein [Xenococcus sp. PCC 7305]ELS01429.1 Domain found in Dishevelled, Egl-10, and Pleckstrin (DEP) [Xenococcus sp. PCC 7305]